MTGSWELAAHLFTPSISFIVGTTTAPTTTGGSILFQQPTASRAQRDKLRYPGFSSETIVQDVPLNIHKLLLEYTK
ncbi:hypothetical protein KQX54_002640 [Cotesia glomerata]|uniref:Uncharacterized protein n=1 Tax=Cotesia glomerata TaxID=32391 RepID=A0AAV7IKY5_COTGL|nr:hypothetical protein KQX54_002640 [Cotesia glomerata]